MSFSKAFTAFFLTFKDVGKNTIKQPNQCSPYQNINPQATDLCLSSILSDSAFPCIEAYFQCLQEKGLSLPNKISKAKVQVFLASRQKVGLSLGVAAKAKLWLFDDNAFDQVKTFLQMIKIPEHQLDATDIT